MYVCMYVCVYACMYVCMYVCIYVCIDLLPRRPNHYVQAALAAPALEVQMLVGICVFAHGYSKSSTCDLSEMTTRIWTILDRCWDNLGHSWVLVARC